MSANDKVRILCVDNHNDGRSAFMQAYLEILRVWTANITPSRDWIFKHVHSAGAFYITPFSATHIAHFPGNLSQVAQTRQSLPLHAFNAQRTFESPEKRQILSRVGNRHIRGLNAVDFREYDIIIAFDEDTMKLLERLRGLAKREGAKGVENAGITMCEFGGGFYESERGFAEAKEKIRGWASRVLGFRYPERDIGEGPWVTRFVTIDDACYQALARNGSKRLEDVRRKTGCMVKFGNADSSPRWVIAVIGGKEEVKTAARMIEDSW